MNKKMARWGRWVGWTFPLFASPFRRWAIRKLAENSQNCESITYLVTAMRSGDKHVSEEAIAALKSLSDQEAINTFCKLWAANFDMKLGEIVAACRYQATAPVRSRILSGLKSGKIEELTWECEKKELAILVEALDHKDPVIRQNGEKVLRCLKNQAAVDEICAIWVKNFNARFGEIVTGCGYKASAPVELRVLSGLKAGKIGELPKRLTRRRLPGWSKRLETKI